MKGRAVKIIVVVVLLAFFGWIASNMRFTEVKMPMPLKGEAARNPFYAAIKLSEQLGAEAAWERVFTAPADDSVIVVSDWNWTLSRARRERIERWVEGGGRLVIDQTLIGGLNEFERWSGIGELEPVKKDQDDEEEESALAERFFPKDCTSLLEDGTQRTIEVCDVNNARSLTSTRKVLWALRAGDRIQALRTAVGRGSVTVINASPFRFRDFFLGDHPLLFVRATQLHRGDVLLFLTEEQHASLITLVWRFGSSVVLLMFAVIALALWRATARFGPLVAPLEAARRSLAEQIRGTGQFALRFGGGQSLHAATVRALRDAAIRRVPAYDRLSSEERVAAVANASGVTREELAPALNFSGSRSSHELRQAIAVLETARRRLMRNKRANNGN
jgi:hypothetical protein